MSEATTTPKKRTGIFTFFAQVRQEGRKVTWASRSETIAATIMVVIMVAVASLFFYIADAIIRVVVGFITR